MPSLAHCPALSLRSLLGLLGSLLLLFGRRRKKSLQHQFLVSNHQDDGNNDRDQNSTGIQNSVPLSPLPVRGGVQVRSVCSPCKGEDEGEGPDTAPGAIQDSAFRHSRIGHYFGRAPLDPPDQTHGHRSGCNARFATAPSRRRERFHIPRSHRAHTPSNLARTGKPVRSSHESTARSPPDKSLLRQSRKTRGAAFNRSAVSAIAISYAPRFVRSSCEPPS